MESLFCTISTSSHLFRVIALFNSIRKFKKSAELYCLIVDGTESDSPPIIAGLIWIFPEQIKHEFRIAEIFQKYAPASDPLRWALKPSLMMHVQKREHCQNVFYCDSDLYFVSNFDFLDKYLTENRILLSPHNRISDPEVDAPWFTTNFKDGIFNGGFVGANKNAVSELKWWEKATAFACEINFAEGRYVDQKYLDMMPALFEKIAIVRHPGCNVAYWNRHECVRSKKNGEIRINENWPIVFIHFTNDLMQAIDKGDDPLLADYLHEYRVQIHLANKSLSLISADK